jgi:hypothetical protein
MMDAFDFTTSEILDWELEKIHNALLREEVGISRHARDAAKDDNISLVQLLESILVGTAVSKDLPNNPLERIPGINYEHRIDDRWIRLKVAWFEGYVVVTAYEI